MTTKKEKKDIIGWIINKQKELAAGMIIEMKETNATTSKVISELLVKKDKWVIETKIKKLLKK